MNVRLDVRWACPCCEGHLGALSFSAPVPRPETRRELFGRLRSPRVNPCSLQKRRDGPGPPRILPNCPRRPREALPRQYPGIPATDTSTAWTTEFKRIWLNTYEVTFVSWYGHSEEIDPPRTVWAGVCNSVAVQTAADRLVVDWYCCASCNPFEDPTTFCSGGPIRSEFQKMPASSKCLPAD